MMHAIVKLIEMVALLGVVTSSLYYLLCLWSAAIFLRQPKAENPVHLEQSEVESEIVVVLPPVSILKPLKGADPEMYECFRSHCRQDYPEYEIIFGVSDPDDPAVDSVKNLQREFPERAIHLVICREMLGSNVKVSNLAQMLTGARYDHFIVNDSDIRVEPDYLARVVAPLAEERIGLVTCLYRGIASTTLGSRLEALGISTDFCPSVLVAQQLEGGIHFGLGSTLAFRRSELEKIGGFLSFVDYLADDYEIGKRIAAQGFSVEISDVVVETFLPAYSLRSFLAHQLRWARGVRDARPGGYFGLIFTFGIFWSLVAVIASHGAFWACTAFVLALALRIASALFVGGRILRDPHALKYSWLIPLRDLFAVGVWLASLAGHTVTWRGDRFRLKDGKLIRMSP